MRVQKGVACAKMSGGEELGMSVTTPGTVAEAGLSRGPFRAARGMLLSNLEPEVAGDGA